MKKTLEIKNRIVRWLMDGYDQGSVSILEGSDAASDYIRNMVWYRGDPEELEQYYMQTAMFASGKRFWAAKPTTGMEIRKMHLSIPSLIVDVLSQIVLSDLNDFKILNGKQEVWDKIEKDNDLTDLLSEAIKDVLVVGDGAFKISYDTDISDYPLIEWYPGDQIDFTIAHNRVNEVIFKTIYTKNSQGYVLHEIYGRGYIRYELYCDGQPRSLDYLPETADLKDVYFDERVMLAVPLLIYKSSKQKGRGRSIYEGKYDAFDGLDETISQWMDALRAGRARTYIPEKLIPRDPLTGMLIRPNGFDNRFISTISDIAEDANDKIEVKQPTIPYESYLSTYITFLDLALQGIISPSTLGIDTKKLDNAEAQREKEKTTLYTRNAIVGALQKTLEKLVGAAINTYLLAMGGTADYNIHIDVPFGEYANPSFESVVETVSKARTSGIMSIEAAIDEMYGDTRDDHWKKEEVQRIKEEQGLAEVDVPMLGEEVSF